MDTFSQFYCVLVMDLIKPVTQNHSPFLSATVPRVLSNHTRGFTLAASNGIKFHVAFIKPNGHICLHYTIRTTSASGYLAV
jgi:hypothetical protein